MHNSLKYRVKTDLKIDSMNLENIVIELKSNRKTILLTSCYQAPNSDQKTFLTDYKKLIEKLKSENSSTLIGLDHNLGLLKTGHHKNTQEFLEQNLSKRFLPCIAKPMQITHSSAPLIDNIFCTDNIYRNCTSYMLCSCMAASVAMVIYAHWTL